MGLIDFNPFGTISIEAKFKCSKCDHEVISDEISVPKADFSADNHSDSIRDNDGYAVCPNCNEEYSIYVYSGIAGGDVDIEGVDDDDIIEIIEHSSEPDNDYLDESDHKKNFSGFKLENLEINNWHILKNTTINFTDNINVLIGENGSGKSSVIEVLALIFGHLHKFYKEDDKTAPYIKGYKIIFKSQDAETGEWNNVSIVSDDKMENNEIFNPIVLINDNLVSDKKIISSILPIKIGLYYAGITKRLEQLSNHFEEKYRKTVTAVGDDNITLFPLNLPPARPFLYLQDGHLGIMLFCMLISDDSKIRDFLQTELGINTETTEIKFNFKKPSWAKDTVENVWGASPLARQFIIFLSQNADDKNIIEDTCVTIHHTYRYIRDQMFLLFAHDREINTFEIFDFLLFNDLLDSVNIYWTNDENDTIDIDHLSEGEKQMISIQALCLLWSNQKGFLLLDEPDIFMHPKWQREFLTNIKEQVVNSSVIITTHSPSIVSDIRKEQLHLMRNGKEIIKGLRSYGKPIDRILIDFFNIESTRNKEVESLISELYEQVNQDNFKSAEFEQKFKALAELIGNDDTDILLLKMEIAKKKYEKIK